MNVLFINHTVQKSGAGISLATLLRHLPAEIEPHFLLPARSEIDALLGARPERTFKERWLCQFPTTLYNAAYPPHLLAWHLVKMPLARRRIGQLVARWNIDVVHLNETVLVPYGVRALPVLMHARTAIAPRRFERGMLERFGRQPHARIAAIDGEVKASLPEAARTVTDVVYNPIDLGPTPAPAEVAALRAAWGCRASDLVVGQVASLHRPKGIWLILELAEKLCAEFPELRFVLVGDDSAAAGEGPQLRAAIAERRLTERVLLPGYDTRLATVYAALDVALCLFGGGLGGVGRAAYEAAIAARPLVATLPDPQRSETLRHGESGLLFTQEDAPGIAEALRRLIRDPDLRTKLGASARTALAPRHDPPAVARTVAGLYAKLAGG